MPDIGLLPKYRSLLGGLKTPRTRLDKARVLPTLGVLFSVSCGGSIDLNGGSRRGNSRHRVISPTAGSQFWKVVSLERSRMEDRGYVTQCSISHPLSSGSNFGDHRRYRQRGVEWSRDIRIILGVNQPMAVVSECIDWLGGQLVSHPFESRSLISEEGHFDKIVRNGLELPSRHHTNAECLQLLQPSMNQVVHVAWPY
jgi:hypothetical protein